MNIELSTEEADTLVAELGKDLEGDVIFELLSQVCINKPHQLGIFKLRLALNLYLHSYPLFCVDALGIEFGTLR